MKSSDSLEAVMASIVEVLPELEGLEIAHSNSLHNLGANSIDRAEILTSAMQKLGVTVSLIEFAKAANIADVVQILDRCKA